MDETKSFLIGEVLRNESDTLPAATEKRLAELRREKPSVPVVYISSGAAAIIAGAGKSEAAIKTYLSDMNMTASVINVGCHGPAVFEPMICIHLPGKNKLIFRNITEEKVESLLNGVFHNDMPADDLVAQQGNAGFEAWHGIPFLGELPYFRLQKRIVLNNCGCYDPTSIEDYIAHGGYRTYVKTIRNYTFEEVCDIIEKSGLR